MAWGQVSWDYPTLTVSGTHYQVLDNYVDHVDQTIGDFFDRNQGRTLEFVDPTFNEEWYGAYLGMTRTSLTLRIYYHSDSGGLPECDELNFEKTELYDPTNPDSFGLVIGTTTTTLASQYESWSFRENGDNIDLVIGLDGGAQLTLPMRDVTTPSINCAERTPFGNRFAGFWEHQTRPDLYSYEVGNEGLTFWINGGGTGPDCYSSEIYTRIGGGETIQNTLFTGKVLVSETPDTIIAWFIYSNQRYERTYTVSGNVMTVRVKRYSATGVFEAQEADRTYIRNRNQSLTLCSRYQPDTYRLPNGFEYVNGSAAVNGVLFESEYPDGFSVWVEWNEQTYIPIEYRLSLRRSQHYPSQNNSWTYSGPEPIQDAYTLYRINEASFVSSSAFSRDHTWIHNNPSAFINQVSGILSLTYDGIGFGSYGTPSRRFARIRYSTSRIAETEFASEGIAFRNMEVDFIYDNATGELMWAQLWRQYYDSNGDWLRGGFNVQFGSTTAGFTDENKRALLRYLIVRRNEY